MSLGYERYKCELNERKVTRSNRTKLLGSTEFIDLAFERKKYESGYTYSTANVDTILIRVKYSYFFKDIFNFISKSAHSLILFVIPHQSTRIDLCIS